MLSEDERRVNLTETVGDAAAVSTMREMINSHFWQPAKTMPGIPHEYSLKWKWSKSDFRFAVNFIWEYGVDAYFGKISYPRRYWFDHESGWYYFVDPSDLDENGDVTNTCSLINRAKISDYIFWAEDSLVDKRINCRVDYSKLKAAKQ